MTSPNFELARQYVLGRLARELAPQINYHSLAHTRDEVVPAAEEFADREGVTGEDFLLLHTAALYHDVGFVEQHDKHEAGSVRIAVATLPGFGYAPAQIEVIVGIILATEYPQQPHFLLEQIMVDADLSILGQADYLPRNAALRAELAAMGRPMTDAQWYGGQLNFIRSQQYYTAAARSLRDAQKQVNVVAMAALLAQCE